MEIVIVRKWTSVSHISKSRMQSFRKAKPMLPFLLKNRILSGLVKRVGELPEEEVT